MSEVIRNMTFDDYANDASINASAIKQGRKSMLHMKHYLDSFRKVNEMENDKIILDACCGGRMFWYDKNNPNALFMDKREVEKGAFQNGWNPNWCVKPDVIADFRNMPFDDCSFKLVVYDPPHLTSGSEKSVINKKYGLLNKETWKRDLVDGFKECWRVLDWGGVLIFKWNEANIKGRELIKEFPHKPLFGDFTGKTGKTLWMTFMKMPNAKADFCERSATE